MWLASVSRRDRTGAIVPASTWGLGVRNKAEKILLEVLRGVGDRSRERLFRMNITLCLHRGMTEKEEDGLPEWWHDACAVDPAGGGVEIFRSRGTSDRPSVMPCLRPTRTYPPGCTDERLWIPIDCGECEPCRDRILVREAPQEAS